MAVDAHLVACQHPGVVRPEDQPVLGSRASSGLARWWFNVSDIQKSALLSLLLFGLVVGAFFPVLRNGFIVYDDPVYVTDNLHVQRGLAWANVGWAFSNTESSNWHPLTWFSHLLDVEIFGLNPLGHHLVSVVLHAVNTVLVFMVFRSLTGAMWRCALLAALFGVHPLRVESVAWISERKDVLSGMFWLLAIWAYTRYVRYRGEESEARGSQATWRLGLRFYLLALLLFTLGLMSKPMLVTLPCVLLLLDYWPLHRASHLWEAGSGSAPSKALRSPWFALVLEKVPFFAIAIAASGITFLVQKDFGAVQWDLPWIGRMANALISYCRYVGKTFCPADLSVVYPYVNHWPVSAILSAGLVLLVFSVMVVALGRGYPYLPVGWFWFLGTLVPVIGLVQVGRQSMADRYTYIPSLGLCLALIWGAHSLLAGKRHLQLACAVATSAIIAVGVALTWQQVGYWRNSETLFRHALATTKGNYIAHYCLGFALDKQGRFDEAIAQYRQALELYPAYADAHNNLGFTLRQQGKLEEAVDQFQQALQINPVHVVAHFNFGFALAQQGRVDDAIAQYQQALQLRPEYPDALNNLGVALARKGQATEALAAYEEAARLQPGSAEIAYNLANAFLRQGRLEEGVAQFHHVLQLHPDHAEAHNNLGVALYTMKRYEEAIVEFQQALRLKPDYLDAGKNLAAALKVKSRIGNQPPAAEPAQ